MLAPLPLPWDLPSAHRRFPTSDLRSATPPPPRRRTHSISSLSPTSSDPSQPHRPPHSEPAPSRHPFVLPKRKQIEPGVWHDGTHRILSAACPSVQAFLQFARRRMHLPPAPSETVFALAALDVFYHIDDPAHWMFWNDEKKHQTAEVVSRIALHRPQLIHSRVAWNGTSEYLFILSSLHGASSLPVYADKEWYPLLNPSKVPSPPRVINLRKRKAHGEPPELDDAALALEAPRSKRAKSGSGLKRQKSPSAESSTNPTDMSVVQSPSIEDSEMTTDKDKDKGTSRKRKRRGTQQQGRSSSSCSPTMQIHSLDSGTTTNMHGLPLPQERPSNSSSDSLLMPPMTESTTKVTTRTRSISQVSAQTVVERQRRSLSVLSTITAVEILTPLPLKIIKDNDDHREPSDSEESKPEEEPEGMVTRGRANKNRNNHLCKDDANATRPSKRAKKKSRS